VTSPGASPSSSLADFGAIAARLLLGGLFVYMGLEKTLHPVEFLKLVRQYDLVQNHVLLNAIAAMLPWVEVFCGMLLAIGIGVRGTALAMFAMLVPFTLAVINRAWHIHDLQSIPFCAIKFDCGCGMGEVFICRKVLENGVLILLALWLTLKPGNRFCIRARL
jgi:uncharacterized membrane protein YphA (DoxX/SURF4 family)